MMRPMSRSHVLLRHIATRPCGRRLWSQLAAADPEADSNTSHRSRDQPETFNIICQRVSESCRFITMQLFRWSFKDVGPSQAYGIPTRGSQLGPSGEVWQQLWNLDELYELYELLIGPGPYHL